MTCSFEINDVSRLREYHELWTEWLQQTPRASYFHTIEWLEAYFHRNGVNERLRAVFVEHNGDPIGVLPLIERVERSPFGPLRVLTYPMDDWGMWYGPIGRQAAATLRVGMRHIAKTPRTWDQIALRWVAHDSTDAARTETAMRLAGLTPRLERHQTTSVLELDRFDDWDAYLASRSAKDRHELRRARRKIEANYNTEYMRVRPRSLAEGDGDPHWSVYDLCVCVSERSWQASSTTGNTLADPKVASWLRDAHWRAAEAGMVDINLLMVDGEPAAYFYNYIHAGRVFGLRTGYDPQVASGAGKALLALLIEDSFNREDACIDLGAGTESFKRKLRTKTETCSRLIHTPRRAWRPQALQIARGLKRRMTRSTQREGASQPPAG